MMTIGDHIEVDNPKLGKLKIIRLPDETIEVDKKKLPCTKFMIRSNDGFVIILTSKDFKKLYFVLPDGRISNTEIDLSDYIRHQYHGVVTPEVLFTDIFSKAEDTEHMGSLSNRLFVMSKVGGSSDHTIAESMMLYEIGADTVMKAYFGISIASLLATVALILRYIGKTTQHKLIERSAVHVEDKIHKELFKGQTPNEEFFLKWYPELVQGVRSIIKGTRRFLIVCGPPGTGKSYVVRRELYFAGLRSGSDYTILRGSTAGLISMVQALFDYRDKIIVLDDFDTLLGDPDIVNILKAATDTYAHRVISFPMEKVVSTQAAQLAGFPDKFEFNGRIIIITNLEPKDINSALLSRAGGYIYVDFPKDLTYQVLKESLKYFDPNVPMNVKEEALDHAVQLCKKYNVPLSFRIFRIILDVRLGYKDRGELWKQMAENIIKSLKREGK